MDVKVGSGAFLPVIEEARELAEAIVEVAAGNGLPTSALLTDMNQVLGRTAGNAVEGWRRSTASVADRPMSDCAR